MRPLWTTLYLAIALGLASGLTSASGAEISKGDDADHAVGASIFMSQDNESFSTQRIAVEYLPRFKHIDSLTGVRYADIHYQQDGWSRDGQQLSFMHRNIDPVTANGWQLEAGMLRQGGHDLLTADGSYLTALGTGTTAEVMINRDVIETANALNDGVHFTFVGGDVAQVLEPHLTVVALAAKQEFSDDNSRNHIRLKFIVQPDLDLGLTLQLRYRSYNSSDISVTYFNPAHYDETMLVAVWRKRIMGWASSLTAGAGEQHVAGDPGTPTRILEISSQSPLNHGYALRVRGGVNQSASFNGPDYRYNYFQAEWIVGL